MDDRDPPPESKRRKLSKIGGQNWDTQEQPHSSWTPEMEPVRCSTPVRDDLQDSDDLANVTLTDIEDGWDDEDGGEELEMERHDLGEREHEGDLSLDYFGLNEDSIDEFVSEVESEEPSLELLPNELLELVFCLLPLQQLLSSCRLVNHRWNSIIKRERFLCWKKRYHLLKTSQHLPTTMFVQQLLYQTKMLGATTGPQPLIRTASSLQQDKPHPSLIHIAKFVGQEFIRENVSEGTLAILQQHQRYSCVQQIAILHPLLKDAETQCQEVMETITLLVACSRSVQEVHSIIKALLTPPRSEGNRFREPLCGLVTVTEVFYCLATLFFALWNKNILPPRFHYFVFYTLDTLERGPSFVPCQQVQSTQQRTVGQQSLLRYSSSSSSVQLTAEQLLIVDHDYKDNETVKIMAFAGTGKTTTLLRLTQLNPNKQYLYCVFNKSVQEYAESIFPRNVECRTFHSLAWKTAGAMYRHKTSPGLSAYKVSQWVKNPPFSYVGKKKKDSLYLFSKWVLMTLESFIASSDEQISQHHVPRMGGALEHLLYGDPELQDSQLVESDYYTTTVIREAKEIWESMKDQKNTEVRMTHDGYLKVFQLQKPVIDKYDYLLIDEAQDLTPAIIATLIGQRCPKILVGDPHQQIYGFRGAKNAMGLVPANHTFYLTKSFRFGPEIAYVASCILDALKGVRKQTIVGELKPGGVLGETSGQVAVIARTNAALFTELVKVCDSGQKIRIGFAGGIEKYEFKKLVDIHKLLQGRPHSEIKDQFIKRFKSFILLKSYAESSNDIPLLGKIKVCEHYLNLPHYVDKIYSLACKGKDLTFADIVFSTAHKSKGLEFSTVKLVDDYLSIEGLNLNDPQLNTAHLPIDECNLLYVGATRAKKQLLMTPTLLAVLKRAGEHFVYPTAAATAMEMTKTTCPSCGLMEQLLPDLRLERPRIALNGIPAFKAAGYLCKSCSLAMPSLCL